MFLSLWFYCLESGGTLGLQGVKETRSSDGFAFLATPLTPSSKPQHGSELRVLNWAQKNLPETSLQTKIHKAGVSSQWISYTQLCKPKTKGHQSAFSGKDEQRKLAIPFRENCYHWRVVPRQARFNQSQAICPLTSIMAAKPHSNACKFLTSGVAQMTAGGLAQPCNQTHQTISLTANRGSLWAVAWLETRLVFSKSCSCEADFPGATW